MKGRDIPYSADELSWIELRHKMPRRDLHAGFCKQFKRSDVSVDTLKQLCLRRGWTTGRTGCFEKGQEPANKGTVCAPGRGGNHPNARRTHFKPGQRTGKAQRNYKPIGSERTSKDGYRERKINDGLPFQSRWRLVHLIRWEAEHGAVPEGMCLKCLDGNRLNTEPANWGPIPRSLLPYLASTRRGGFDYDAAPAELKPAILATAKLKAAGRKRVSA